MPTVEFLGNALGPAVTLDTQEGGRLVDLCDDVHAPVDFSCRSASCGTCRVDVLEGAELLDPPHEEEREVLDIFLASKSERLACQAVVRRGEGKIRLAWISD